MLTFLLIFASWKGRVLVHYSVEVVLLMSLQVRLAKHKVWILDITYIALLAAWLKLSLIYNSIGTISLILYDSTTKFFSSSWVTGTFILAKALVISLSDCGLEICIPAAMATSPSVHANGTFSFCRAFSKNTFAWLIFLIWLYCLPSFVTGCSGWLLTCIVWHWLLVIFSFWWRSSAKSSTLIFVFVVLISLNFIYKKSVTWPISLFKDTSSPAALTIT